VTFEKSDLELNRTHDLGRRMLRLVSNVGAGEREPVPFNVGTNYPHMISDVDELPAIVVRAFRGCLRRTWQLTSPVPLSWNVTEKNSDCLKNHLPWPHKRA
jgi:hypothetical protein